MLQFDYRKPASTTAAIGVVSISRTRGNVSDLITDPKLLARVRRLIAAEHAGYKRDDNGRAHICLELGCSCDFDTCGPFRKPLVRCTSFENMVLPLDPDLQAAYWEHLRSGAALGLRRCKRPQCRRGVSGSGPRAKYCKIHADLNARAKNRERVRRFRAKTKGVPV